MANYFRNSNHGHDLVLLTATLAAFGTAPVPSASLFMLAAVLAAVGVEER